MSPRARSNAITRPMSLMMLGWMPSVGSSSTSRRGCITSARPMASCCCWPPDRSPPRRRSMVARIGNSAKISSGMTRWRRGNTAKPVSRFSRTVSSGKMSRPCGTLAMPRRARSKVGIRVMSAPSHLMLPRVTGCAPVTARSRLVLPTPLRPSRQVTSPTAAFSDTPRSAMAAP